VSNRFFLVGAAGVVVMWVMASSIGAVAADSVSPRADRLFGEEQIDADYRVARDRCNALSGNAGDVCVAEAKAKQRIAHADADAQVKDTPRARYDARVVRAEAEYQVARERCGGDRGGAAKDTCLRDAQAAEARAKADANADLHATESQSSR